MTNGKNAIIYLFTTIYLLTYLRGHVPLWNVVVNSCGSLILLVRSRRT